MSVVSGASYTFSAFMYSPTTADVQSCSGGSTSDTNFPEIGVINGFAVPTNAAPAAYVAGTQQAIAAQGSWIQKTATFAAPSATVTLVMHGKHDQVIPFAVGMQLYEQLRVPKELLVSETAGHCELATAEPQRYYDTIVKFVRSTSPVSN